MTINNVKVLAQTGNLSFESFAPNWGELKAQIAAEASGNDQQNPLDVPNAVVTLKTNNVRYTEKDDVNQDLTDSIALTGDVVIYVTADKVNSGK